MEDESQISSWHNRVVMVTGVASIFLGTLVLAGWYTHNTVLIQVLPAFVPMQYNTALGFLLCGMGLFSMAHGTTRLAFACGAVAGAIGLLTLIEYVFGLSLGIDQFLMDHYITVETSHPGRMAPNTALCFSLTGAALLLRRRLAQPRRRAQLVGGLGVLIIALSAVAFSGYLSGASTAYGWGHVTRMAVHTAAGFIVLGAGVLALAWGEGTSPRGERADDPARERRRVAVLSIMIMTAVTLTVALNVIRELRHTSVELRQKDLSTLTKSWAALIAAVARFDAVHCEQDHPDGAEAATLSQIAAAQEELSGVWESGEFSLARREGDQIVYLLEHRHRGQDDRRAAPFDSELDEPMRRALSGESGTLIGHGYRDETVLAAYHPVGQYGWGLVARVDLAEIWAPYKGMALLAILTALIAIALGALGLIITVDPLIRGLVERTAELKREGDERLKSEARYRDLYDNAPDMFASIDAATGNILECNETLARATACTKEEIIGRPVLEIYHPDSIERVKQAFESFATTGEMHGIELQLKRKDGTTIDVSLNASANRDEQGNILHSRSVLRDITERKQAEEELEKHREHLEELVQKRTADLGKRVSEVELLNAGMANLLEDLQVGKKNLELTTGQLTEANKELEAFSYSVSHDLRSPLRAIDGFSHALLEDCADQLDENGINHLNRVIVAARRMGGLIDDMLNLSRITRKNMAPKVFDLSEVALQIVTELRDGQPERAVETAIQPGMLVEADPYLVRALLDNLLGNAWKFTERTDEAKIEFGANQEKDVTTYYVRDNGAGFDMQYADKLFGAFQRLHQVDEFEGTGIGLATAQRIVNRHGGRIWAEAEVGKGATFKFTLS